MSGHAISEQVRPPAAPRVARERVPVAAPPQPRIGGAARPAARDDALGALLLRSRLQREQAEAQEGAKGPEPEQLEHDLAQVKHLFAERTSIFNEQVSAALAARDVAPTEHDGNGQPAPEAGADAEAPALTLGDVATQLQLHLRDPAEDETKPLSAA